MHLATTEIRRLARERGLSLSAFLKSVGVSRTAYYALARRPTLLPKTVRAIADGLGVAPSEILADVPERLREARRVCARYKQATFENVWHALALLDLPPAERLHRSLTRGRPRPVHR